MTADDMLLALHLECAKRVGPCRAITIDSKTPIQDIIEVADALADEGRIDTANLLRAFSRVMIGVLWFDANDKVLHYFPTKTIVFSAAQRFDIKRVVFSWDSYTDWNCTQNIYISFSDGSFFAVSAVDALNSYADEVAKQ